MIQEKQIIILEQEKESNPIIKVVYNKIRNLNKKIAQIQHIKTLDPKTLKAAQINKLNKRQEILQEIQKQEDFAINYKKILIQNNLVYDKVDDLLKISTLLAVGKRIRSQQYCPIEAKNIYNAFYDPIFTSNKESKTLLSDEVIKIYHYLWKYIQKDQNYSQCRDYLTYIKEIDQRKASLADNGNHKQKLNMKIKNDHKQYNLADLLSKSLKMKIESNVLELKFNNFVNKQNCSQVYSYRELNIQQKLPILQIPIRKQLSQDLQTKNSSQDTPLLNQQEINEFEMQICIQESTISPQKKEIDIQTRQMQYQIYPPSIQSKQHKRNTKNKRQRKNRNHLQVEVDFNVRKCSDTSLEPTPDKCKGKKLRYIQKAL